MVGAGDAVATQGTRLLGAQSCAAVPAGIVEGAQHAGIIPHQKNVLAGDLERPVAARCLHLFGARDIHPVMMPDALHFDLMARGIEIELRRKAGSDCRQTVEVGVGS